MTDLLTGLLANWVLMKQTLKTSWKGRQVAGACRKCRVLSGATGGNFVELLSWWLVQDISSGLMMWEFEIASSIVKNSKKNTVNICWLMDCCFRGFLFFDGHHLQLANHRIFNQRSSVPLTGRGNRLRWRMWRRGTAGNWRNCVSQRMVQRWKILKLRHAFFLNIFMGVSYIKNIWEFPEIVVP